MTNSIILLLAILFSVVTLFNFIVELINKYDNIHKRLLFILITSILWSIYHYTSLTNVNNLQQSQVDLPEEYMEMSHDSNKPDTLLGFYDNDKVYITFTSKTDKP